MLIEGVIVEHLGVAHEDYRRIILAPFNSDVPGFPAAEQAKVAIVKESTTLGGHSHKYGELFSLLDGEAIFRLRDINDPGKKMEIYLKKGDRLLIPAGVAHSVKIKGGSVLLGLTEKKYTSPQENDIPCDAIDWNENWRNFQIEF